MGIDKDKKKALVTAYRQSFRPMGIYQIRNLDTGKIFVDASMDLHATRNRHQFTTGMERSPIPELLQDWKVYGGKRFVFEILDELRPREEVADPADLQKYKGELHDLLALWLDKLQPYGDRGYNQPKPLA